MLGANGAGKSTIMRALSGLLRPVGGNIVLDDKQVARWKPIASRAPGLALVPEGRQVFGELDVRDNLRARRILAQRRRSRSRDRSAARIASRACANG